MKKYIRLSLSLLLCLSTAVMSGNLFAAETKQEQQKKLATLPYLKQIHAPEVWKEKDAKGQPVKGKGITIAVIDSGFDAGHPDFAGVKYSGYDYITKSKTLIDPMGHGTHVAGISKRVAPEANFLFYRVLHTLHEFLGLNICQAMEQAINDGADVINLSVVYPGTAKTDIFKRVIEKATKKGIVVVVGAGNDGPTKGNMWSILANSTNVITVGACTKEIPITTLQLNGDSKVVETIPALLSPPFPTKGKYPILDLGKSTDLKHAKGKIILVKRGEKFTPEFLFAAKRAGVTGVIAINKNPGEWYGEEDIFLGFIESVVKKNKSKIAPFVTVSGCMGTYLGQQIAKGKKQVTLGSVTKERMACFSTSGPSRISLKNPDVVAPGADIYSSYPVKLNKTGHKLYSGTSMATPMVSGAVALLKQKHPDWTPGQIKAALANSAVTLMTSENVRAPYLVQGSGRIDVLKAVHADTFLTPSQLRFGNLKSAETKKAHKIDRTLYLQNASDKDKAYQLSVELVTGKSHLKIQLPSTVTVKAKSKKGIPLSLQTLPNIPKGVYAGSIRVKCGKEQWKVPYSFIVDLKPMPFFGLF